MVDNRDTERHGIHAVGAAFTKLGWIFREQTTDDYGIDAQVEIKEDGRPTGKLIALQIKSGPSYFRKSSKARSYTYYGQEKHLRYWERHALPVFLILHHPNRKLILWQRIERRLVKTRKNGSWSIEVPRKNALDEEAKRYLSKGIGSDDESVRRFRLALDADLIALLADKPDARMRVQERLDKGAFRFRTIEFWFDPDNLRPDIVQDDVYHLNSVHQVMTIWFPWLNYEYAEPVPDEGAAAHHQFRISVNAIGRAFLTLQEFYQHGPEPKSRPEPPEDEDALTEDEQLEEDYRRNIEKD
jgi:hypothetical protein